MHLGGGNADSLRDIQEAGHSITAEPPPRYVTRSKSKLLTEQGNAESSMDIQGSVSNPSDENEGVSLLRYARTTDIQGAGQGGGNNIIFDDVLRITFRYIVEERMNQLCSCYLLLFLDQV